MSTLAPATTPLSGAADRTLGGGRATRSLWGDAWRRLRRNRMAMVSLVYLGLLVIVAVAAPAIAPQNPVGSNVRAAGQYRLPAWQDDADPRRSGDWAYPLGTDSIGRDIFSRLVYGTRVSLVVGFIPMAVILLIGVPIGLLSGFAGGWLDGLLMRITDVVYAFPGLLFFIIVQVSLRDTAVGEVLNGLVLLFLTLSVVNWSGVARLVRGDTLALKEKEFVEAARANGAGAGRIILRHVLPNALGPIIVAGAFIVPGAIIAEATLSYLGIGVRPSTNLDAPFPTSWGAMILDGSSSWESQPWMLIAPGLAVALITLAFTFLGDGLRDALDPRGT
ncbi:MAG: Dipeptide transport system permease protein DppC [uncultured Thermomicrobiales bacterium]|uniref:Dipeptide transport system permease protein DppC n=1 Tax=uncultured Thermomicrobiales bacterium TaxID=1645740 RepID=A0A6J4U1K1_9BACT|nr:MAG: Dipeptide transport system permease protein DppC [uncultured Thermomicrobiales bacterium]